MDKLVEDLPWYLEKRMDFEDWPTRTDPFSLERKDPGSVAGLAAGTGFSVGVNFQPLLSLAFYVLVLCVGLPETFFPSISLVLFLSALLVFVG